MNKQTKAIFWSVFVFLNFYIGFCLNHFLNADFVILAPLSAYIIIFIIHYFAITKIIIVNRCKVLKLEYAIKQLYNKKFHYLVRLNNDAYHLDSLNFLDQHILYYETRTELQKQIESYIDNVSFFPTGFFSPFRK